MLTLIPFFIRVRKMTASVLFLISNVIGGVTFAVCRLKEMTIQSP